MDYEQQPPQHPTPEISTGLRATLIIGTIFVQLIGIILGAIWMTDQSSSQEKRKFGKTLLTLGIVMMVIQCICGVLYVGLFTISAFNTMAF